MKKLSINKQAVKDNVLKAYVILTFLGLFSATVFYAGTQYAAHADSAGHVVVVQPKK